VNYSNEYNVEPERLSGEVHHRQTKDDHPFILRNPDKCILCGLCVRICEEVMGETAIGLVSRGFDTIVKPALELPLNKTSCISCGQCISVCPTGALQEKLNIDKPVPVKTNSTKTICAQCSVGCNIDLNTKGNLLVRALPVEESKVDNGLLCSKGRFGFDVAQNGERLDKPMIKKNGKLEEVSWDEALQFVSRKAQSLKMIHGENSIALTVSDRYTNEEIYLIKKLGEEVIKTNNITSFNSVQHGIKDVLGYDASTNTYDELLSTNTIILFGSDIMANHTIVGLKIKRAVENGAKLVVINPFDSQADEWAYRKYIPKNNISFLKEIAKALIDKGIRPQTERVSGLDEFVEDLETVQAGDIAKEIAEIYGSSKKAMIVFDQNYVSEEAAKMLANIAVITGHIGKARSGIIQLKPNSNSQGLIDMGVSVESTEILEGLEKDTIKGLLVFGEDIQNVDLSKLEFLMVQDTHLTETAKLADVVIPAVSFAETVGTFTSSERRIQKISQAIPPVTGYENWKITTMLGNILSGNMNYMSTSEVLAEIAKVNKNYKAVTKYIDSGVFWPIDDSPVLYNDGFNFSDKKARLQIVEDDSLFREMLNTNHLKNKFIGFLKENELV